MLVGLQTLDCLKDFVFRQMPSCVFFLTSFPFSEEYARLSIEGSGLCLKCSTCIVHIR